jgi:tetratricopeptide (TPR) repeat protein
MKKLNTKLFVGLIAFVIVGTAALFLTHWFQSGRIARALLWQAKHAEDEAKPEKVATYLSRYLEFAPNDLEERAHLAQTLAGDKVAVSLRGKQHAIFVIEQVLARDPSRHDLRKDVVRLALELFPPRFDLANEHLDALNQALPQDGEVARLFGQWNEAHKQEDKGDQEQFPGDAIKWYREAIQRAPQQIETYEKLAALLHRKPDTAKQAAAVLDQLVQANGRSFQAYLTRAKFLQQANRDDDAAQDVERAKKLAPDEADVILAVGDLEKSRKQLDAARTVLKHGLELHPKDWRMYDALARVEAEADRHAAGATILRQGIKAFTGEPRNKLLWVLGNLHIDDADWAGVQEVVTQLKEGKSSPTSIDYLQGRVHLGRRAYAEAAHYFEKTRPLLEAATSDAARDVKEILTLVNLYLGQCYQQLNEPSRQLAAFSRLLALSPNSVAGLLGAASANQSLGRLDDALVQFRKAATAKEAAGPAWIEITRLLIGRNLQRPGSNRDWQDVKDALAQAEKLNPDAVELVLLRKELLAEEGQIDQAEALIAKARDAKPKQVEFWAALADLADRRNQPEQAAKLLDDAERQCGDSVDLRLARARSLAGRRAAAPELLRLAQGRERFNAEDQGRLLAGVAEAAMTVGHQKEARELWSQLAKEPRFENDLRLRQLLFDFAIDADDEPAMKAELAHIRRIEGDSDAMWRYGEALRLIWSSRRQGGAAALDEARIHLDRVAAQRPTWPAVFLAKAEVEQMKGRPEQAIAHYRRAIELGEQSPRAVRPLVQLLTERHRDEEADQEIRKLQKQMNLTGDLQRLAAAVSLRNQDATRAVELARQAVSADSKDYRDFLWLGQVLAASGKQPQEAETKLRRAVELGDTVPETWLALIRFLALTNPSQAEATLQQARAKLPADQAALALAQGYEALGKTDQAREQYQAALTAKPDDVTVVNRVALFSMRNNRQAEAEPLLRQVLDRKFKASDSDIAWARRRLALVLATSGDYRRFLEGLKLVGLSLDDAGKIIEDKRTSDEPLEDQRARARVLATQKSRPLRARAITLLEELNRRQALNTVDQFLLAQLYESEGNWTKAREQMRELATGPTATPFYVAHLAEWLLRHKETADAGRAIDKLQQLEKSRQVETNAYGSIELGAQYLEQCGEADKALALLKAYAERPGAAPHDSVLLLGHYGRQKRPAEALALCEQLWQTCPPEMAGGASVAVLRIAPPADEQCNRVENRLKAALDKNPDSVPLLVHLADLHDLRGRFADAEQVYRRILGRDPRNIVALNNLAWLLAQRADNGKEALPLIERAIDVLGPRPELLDTRAIAYLALKQGDLAVRDVERALADTPTPTRYFHLARAQRQANNRDAAIAALKKARASGLEPDLLHPVERGAYRTMLTELDQR